MGRYWYLEEVSTWSGAANHMLLQPEQGTPPNRRRTLLNRPNALFLRCATKKLDTRDTRAREHTGAYIFSRYELKRASYLMYIK